MNYIFSNHAMDQLQERKISIQQVEQILENPQQVIKDDKYTVYQSIIKFGNKDYLVRVFLNEAVSPGKIITVYKTSKINKYYEGEI